MVALASAVSLCVVVGRHVCGVLGQVRRRAYFDNIYANSRATAVELDSNGATLMASPQLFQGRHLPKADLFLDAFSAVSDDPMGDLRILHQQCDQIGNSEEIFYLGTRPLRINVRKSKNGRYIWEIDDAAIDLTVTTHANHVPVVQVDPDGVIETANAAFDQLFETRPRGLADLAAELDSRKDQEVMLETVEGRQIFDTKFLLDRTGAGVSFFFSGSWTDSALSDAQIFENVPVPMMFLNDFGKIMVINQAARKLLAGSVELGDSLHQKFIATTQSTTAWLDHVKDNAPAQLPEFLKQRGRPDETIFQAILTPFGATKTLFLCTLTDVTELKSLEAQFVQSQKMQAIGQLAGGVAHDFNNLLTAISGYCDLLLMGRSPEDPAFADLMQIHENTNRAAGLVGQLLAFSRKQNLKFQSLNVRDTMADLGHLLNRLVGERVKLTLNHGTDLNPVRADKRQFEQVLMNLVVNARDAMPDGGMIEINTESLKVTRSTKRSQAVIAPGEYVNIAVIDQGTGIPPDMLDKIFEPFVTSKRTGEGTGLGLSTVYGIIKQTGGYIFVESLQGEGTRFDVLLPAPPVGVAKAEAAKTDDPMPLARSEGVVLLVEDETPVRAFASRALKLKGYDVLEADCAEIALDMLDDKDLHVDVFVTDVIMPGMDGPTWVARAKQDRPGVRIVFVSGYAEDSFVKQKDSFEGAAFLSKPFSLTDLTQTVDRMLA